MDTTDQPYVELKLSHVRDHHMRIIERGESELLGWMDPDDARRWMAEN